MTTQTIHTEIKREIIRSFAVIDEWFDREQALLMFKPSMGDFNLRDVLERIVHANEYLLKHDRTAAPSIDTIEKGVADHWLSLVVFNELGPLNPMPCPDASCDLDSIRQEFRDQLDHCICILELLYGGSETDLVKDAERIEVYQRISFISIYLKCQIKNMLNIEREFTGQLCES